MKYLICDICHKKTKELNGFNYSEIKMCNKCYIVYLESKCESLRSYILNSFSEQDKEKFLKECCKGKLFDDVLKTFKPNVSIADLEAKLAESEERFVVANNLRKKSDEVLLNYKTEKYGLDKTIQELRKIKLSMPEKEWYYKGFENCERQMSSHIADLTLENKQIKQQLEEKDEQIKKRVMVYEKQFIEQTDEIYSLQQQLVEKQNTIDEINKEFVQAVHDWKTLCAEKDKEIERLRKNHRISYTNQKKAYENLKNSMNTQSLIKYPKKLDGCLIKNEQQLLDYAKESTRDIIYLRSERTKFAIQELEKVNGILTDTIIETTQNEFDLNKLCYLEEISAKFYEKMQEQIKELKGE